MDKYLDRINTKIDRYFDKKILFRFALFQSKKRSINFCKVVSLLIIIISGHVVCNKGVIRSKAYPVLIPKVGPPPGPKTVEG